MLELASTAIVVSLLVSGIALGIGIAFRIKGLLGFGKQELFHSIVNAALVGSFAMIVTMLSSSSADCSGECSLVKAVNHCDNALSSAIDIGNKIGYVEMLKVQIIGQGNSIEYMPMTGLRHPADAIGKMINELSGSRAIMQMTLNMITDWKNKLIDSLLVFGVILRLFAPTRKAGNLVIGIAAGFAMGFTISMVSGTGIAEKALEESSGKLLKNSKDLEWIPQIHYGDQGSVEELAEKSPSAKEASKNAVLAMGDAIAAARFVSQVVFASSIVIGIAVAFGTYKMLGMNIFVNEGLPWTEKLL